MQNIDSVELGGTLFIPANHKDLKKIVSGEKYSNLRSLVVDTEDSLNFDDLLDSIESIKDMLASLSQTAVLIFLRPRNIGVLKTFLEFKDIDKINGFILPKFSLDNADGYLELLQNTQHFIMPSIEGSELFEENKLIKLREKLLSYKGRIILIRFGLEDMLRQLKMRRNCEDSIFDFSVTDAVLGSFIAIFKSAGFDISGGVYPCFKDPEGFKKDVLRDLKEGLISKTIIHPNQIEMINELYKVEKKDFDESIEICKSSHEVFNQDGKMAEKITMLPFARDIIKRAEVYGLVTYP